MCLPQNPCRLLIVEDDPSLVDLLSNPLQRVNLLREGLECTIAPDLATAVKILSAADRPEFDGMLIDPHLPDSRDEKATLSRLCGLAPDVAPFVYTGGVDDDFYEFAKTLNVEHIFIKMDWDMKHLFIMLHYGVGQARAKKRLRRERDEWKAATAEALKKSEDLIETHNGLLEKNMQDVVPSERVKAMKNAAVNLVEAVKQLAAGH